MVFREKGPAPFTVSRVFPMTSFSGGHVASRMFCMKAPVFRVFRVFRVLSPRVEPCMALIQHLSGELIGLPGMAAAAAAA